MKIFKMSVLMACVCVLTMALIGCGPNMLEQTQKHNYIETPYVDYSISDLPEFVDDVSAFTDTEKQYVLPDGYLYSYERIPTYSAINQLMVAVDVDGSLYNSVGYKDNTRIRAVLTIEENEGSFVTGFIPVKPGDTIYFSNNCFNPLYEKAGWLNTVFYDGKMKAIEAVDMLSATEKIFEPLEQNEDGYILSLKIRTDFLSEDLSYVRFSLIGSGIQQIISVNEPLVPNYETSDWVQLEKYIPAGWHQEIDETVGSIQRLYATNNSSVSSFVFSTDIHLGVNPKTSYTQSLGRICAEVMRLCDIPFFISGGDNCTQSEEYMPNVFEDNMKSLLVQLSPIPQRNILLAVGNHDGATGVTTDASGEKIYYRYQLSNEQRSSVFFNWQRATNEYKRFGSEGTYYYMDDASTKIRYIVMNSHWSLWEGNEDGFVKDIQHSFFHVPLFGSEQLTWFAEEALDMPPDYGAVIITHFAQAAQDFNVFQGIVKAFSNHDIYIGEYIGLEKWQSTQMAVNYQEAYGEIIAIFQGHKHEDIEYDVFGNVPCVNTTTTGAYWAVKDEKAEERVKNTPTEFAVDIVTIDRNHRKIYLTRLGSGDDRVIEY